MDKTPEDVRKLGPKYLNREWLIRKATFDTGDDSGNVAVLYDLDTKYYQYLTPYQKYLKTLAFYDIIAPGSEQFLCNTRCFKLAFIMGNNSLLEHFAEMVPDPESLIDDVNQVQNEMPKTFKDLFYKHILTVQMGPLRDMGRKFPKRYNKYLEDNFIDLWDVWPPWILYDALNKDLDLPVKDVLIDLESIDYINPLNVDLVANYLDRGNSVQKLVAKNILEVFP